MSSPLQLLPLLPLLVSTALAQLREFDFDGDLLPSYSAQLDTYSQGHGQGQQLPGYRDDLQGSYSQRDSKRMSNIDMLRMSVPGTPGEDYPIFSEVPDTGFDCQGMGRDKGEHEKWI